MLIELSSKEIDLILVGINSAILAPDYDEDEFKDASALYDRLVGYKNAVR